MADTDSEGRPLDGAHRCTTTFPPGGETPGDSFRSLSRYLEQASPGQADARSGRAAS